MNHKPKNGLKKVYNTLCEFQSNYSLIQQLMNKIKEIISVIQASDNNHLKKGHNQLKKFVDQFDKSLFVEFNHYYKDLNEKKFFQNLKVLVDKTSAQPFKTHLSTFQHKSLTSETYKQLVNIFLFSEAIAKFLNEILFALNSLINKSEVLHKFFSVLIRLQFCTYFELLKYNEICQKIITNLTPNLKKTFFFTKKQSKFIQEYLNCLNSLNDSNFSWEKIKSFWCNLNVMVSQLLLQFDQFTTNQSIINFVKWMQQSFLIKLGPEFEVKQLTKSNNSKVKNQLFVSTNFLNNFVDSKNTEKEVGFSSKKNAKTEQKSDSSNLNFDPNYSQDFKILNELTNNPNYIHLACVQGRIILEQKFKDLFGDYKDENLSRMIESNSDSLGGELEKLILNLKEVFNRASHYDREGFFKKKEIIDFCQKQLLSTMQLVCKKLSVFKAQNDELSSTATQITKILNSDK